MSSLYFSAAEISNLDSINRLAMDSTGSFFSEIFVCFQFLPIPHRRKVSVKPQSEKKEFAIFVTYHEGNYFSFKTFYFIEILIFPFS
jgi:hypothetical protein